MDTLSTDVHKIILEYFDLSTIINYMFVSKEWYKWFRQVVSKYDLNAVECCFSGDWMIHGHYSMYFRGKRHGLSYKEVYSSYKLFFTGAPVLISMNNQCYKNGKLYGLSKFDKGTYVCYNERYYTGDSLDGFDDDMLIYYCHEPVLPLQIVQKFHGIWFKPRSNHISIYFNNKCIERGKLLFDGRNGILLTKNEINDAQLFVLKRFAEGKYTDNIGALDEYISDGLTIVEGIGLLESYGVC